MGISTIAPTFDFTGLELFESAFFIESFILCGLSPTSELDLWSRRATSDDFPKVDCPKESGLVLIKSRSIRESVGRVRSI